MSDDDGDLALLLETTDMIELAGVRSLLEGHDIEFVVQGELHSAMVTGMFGNPAIAPRVLVAKRDLDKAVALLKAEPEGETEADPTADLADNVCPVHLKQALATCGRCGTFLCADCKAIGKPPLCEDCGVSEDFERRPKQQTVKAARKVIAAAMVIPVLISIGLGLIMVIVMMFRGR